MNEALNKIVDIPKLVKTIWIILWITLLMFLGLKWCFNIWYPIVVESKTFIKVCDFIDNHLWLEFAIGLISYVFTINVWILTSIKRKLYNSKFIFIFINIFILIGYILKFYENSIGFVVELSYLIFFPILYNILNNTFKINKKNLIVKNILNFLFPIINYLIINLWQMNILFIRGIDNYLTTMPLVIVYIMQIDYYIFLIINWIGVNFMGYMSGGWFWSRKLTQLEAKREKELSKFNPDQDYIKHLDEKISSIKQKHVK